MQRVFAVQFMFILLLIPTTSSAQSSAALLTSVSVGAAHACGLTPNGAAVCWGSNAYGQLGAGAEIASSDVPVSVGAQGRAFIAISAGAAHTCAVAVGGDVLCWGLDVHRQLGRPGASELCAGEPCSRLPVRVRTGAIRFDSVALGHDHSCALGDGKVFCWGRNDRGQLGSSAGPELCDGVACGSVPTVVVAGGQFTSITAGGAHSCAIAEDAAYCWGANQFGQLGAGSFDPGGPAMRRVVGASPFVAIDAGGLHTCARARDGRAYCWGRNETGTLGAARNDAVAAPVAVAGDYRFASISAGGTHTCGLTVQGGTVCWGSNVDQRLGAIERERCGDAPCARVPVPARERVLAHLSAGGTATCGVDAARITCWGTGYSPTRAIVLQRRGANTK
jgi:alpha-tubulin suppressor-like RCC1 family protein